MTCELSYPTDLLKKDSPLFDEILTPQGTLDLKDPAKNIPRETIIAGSNALNKAFNGITSIPGPVSYPYDAFAEEFPTLADKLKTAGPVTQVEAAIFSNDYGQNLDEVAKVFNDYVPGTTPTQEFKDVCTQLDQFYNKNMGAALSAGLCGAFPNIFAQIAAAIALVESVKGLIDDIKSFDPEAFINGLVAQVLGPLKAIAEAIKKTIDNLAKSLKKAAQQIADDIKDAVKDFKAAATKVINRIKKAVNKVLDFLKEPNMEKLKNSVESLITGAASSFEKLDLQTLALLMFRFCQLAGAVQDFMKRPLEGLAKLALTIKGQQAIMKSMSKEQTKKAVEAGAVRINPEEVQNIKNESRNALNNAALTVDEIVSIARQALDNVEDDPIVSTGTGQVTLEGDEVIPYGINVDDSQVEKIEGADVVPLEKDIQREAQVEVRREERKPRAPMYQSGFDAVEIRPYIHIMLPTDEQRSILNQLATDPDIIDIPGKFIFGQEMIDQTVRRDGVDTQNPGPAWMEVNSEIWLKLLEVQEQVNKTLDIHTGYKPDSGSTATGNAVTLNADGMSIDDKIRYIIAASRAGFKQIIIIGGSMTLSDEGGRYGFDSTTDDPLLKDALRIHEADEWITWRPAVQVR